MCSKVLNEGKWAGKYHYAWDKVFPAMPPNTPRAYRKLTHACLDSKFANRPTATEILAALAVIAEETLTSKSSSRGPLDEASAASDAPRPAAVAAMAAAVSARAGCSVSELYM